MSNVLFSSSKHFTAGRIQAADGSYYDIKNSHGQTIGTFSDDYVFRSEEVQVSVMELIELSDFIARLGYMFFEG